MVVRQRLLWPEDLTKARHRSLWRVLWVQERVRTSVRAASPAVTPEHRSAR